MADKFSGLWTREENTKPRKITGTRSWTRQEDQNAKKIRMTSKKMQSNLDTTKKAQRKQSHGILKVTNNKILTNVKKKFAKKCIGAVLGRRSKPYRNFEIDRRYRCQKLKTSYMVAQLNIWKWGNFNGLAKVDVYRAVKKTQRLSVWQPPNDKPDVSQPQGIFPRRTHLHIGQMWIWEQDCQEKLLTVSCTRSSLKS